MTFTTYLFDLDGTLIDSVQLIVSSHQHTCATHFGQPLEAAQHVANMGRTLEDIYSELAQRFGGDPVEIVETYRRHNLAHHDAMVSAYPGVQQTLATLAAHGAKLAVVTSKRVELAWQGLRVCGLDGFFETVVGGRCVPRGKPDPMPILHALSLLGVEADRSVMVGDSTHDIIAGRAAGASSAAALWGPFSRSQLEQAQPDHYLERISDVLGL